MLSQRKLHFTSRQIFWDCSGLIAPESIPSGLPAQLDANAAVERNRRMRLQAAGDADRQGPPAYDGNLAGGAASTLEELWRRVVRSYTTCKLFHQTDKLVAV